LMPAIHMLTIPTSIGVYSDPKNGIRIRNHKEMDFNLYELTHQE
jgi:hypothetical protein